MARDVCRSGLSLFLRALDPADALLLTWYKHENALEAKLRSYNQKCHHDGRANLLIVGGQQHHHKHTSAGFWDISCNRSSKIYKFCALGGPHFNMYCYCTEIIFRNLEICANIA
jgi:hypothetical protein